MPQTSISDNMSKGYAGQIASGGMPIIARSGVAEGASVAAGMPVKRGTAPGVQVEPFEAGDEATRANFAGIVVLDTSRAYSASGIEDEDKVDVLRFGSVLLNFAEAVSAGERVGLTLASGALSGIAEGVAPGAGVVILPCVRIVETIGAAGLAEVEIDLIGEADGSAVMPEGALPAFAAGDLVVPDYPPSGTVYDVPTTAANSTVTLPAAAHEGCEITFVADGTKNGHTVQYRDATGPTNLTAALTASKRHLVRAVHLNDAWYCSSTVAP